MIAKGGLYGLAAVGAGVLLYWGIQLGLALHVLYACAHNGGC